MSATIITDGRSADREYALLDAVSATRSGAVDAQEVMVRYGLIIGDLDSRFRNTCDDRPSSVQGVRVEQPDTSLLELLVRHTETWNRHDLEALMGLFADDCVFEASGGEEVCGERYQGRVEVTKAFAKVFETMPDARWGDGRHYSLAPDYGVSEWTLTGTLPDGRRLEVNGCDFLTVRDGRITVKNSYRKQRPPIESPASRQSQS